MTPCLQLSASSHTAFIKVVWLKDFLMCSVITDSTLEWCKFPKIILCSLKVQMWCLTICVGLKCLRFIKQHYIKMTDITTGPLTSFNEVIIVTLSLWWFLVCVCLCVVGSWYGFRNCLHVLATSLPSSAQCSCSKNEITCCTYTILANIIKHVYMIKKFIFALNFVLI